MDKQISNYNGVSRRGFLKATGLTVIATGMGTLLVACGDDTPDTPGVTPTNQAAIVPGAGQAGAGATTAANTSGGPAATAAPTTTAAPTATPQPPVDPMEIVGQYLKAWNEGRYADMYTLLTINAHNFIAQDKFVTRYKNIAEEATITAVQAQIATTAKPPISGQLSFDVPINVAFKTGRVGDFSQDNVLHMMLDDHGWRVDWTPAAIFKELDNTTYLVRMVPYNPDRGQIIAQNNQPLSQQATLYEVYVVPGQIQDETAMLSTMSQLISMDQDKIKALYKDGQPDWRMPIKNLPSTTPPDIIQRLSELQGVGVDQGQTRSYPQGQVASQVVGYINAVNADDLKTLAAKGYSESDVVGRVGVEAWGEDLLAGGFGGKLTVVRDDGTTVSTLQERAATPAVNLILNLDLNIQKQAETLLAQRVGSIVVLDPTTGATLALASYPRYDPNLFVNGITTDQFNALNNDPNHPFQNRAVNGLLPTGSTFKVITMSAALEKAGLTPQTRFVCTGHWTGLGPQFAKDCWNKSGHGSISIQDGLTQSCDVVFYELGKKLDEIDSSILPSFAKAFGLGSSTGMIGLYDSAGQVPDSEWKSSTLNQPWVRGDAVNLAIGQGYLLASPLQLALVYAAIANGGSQPVPRLVDRAEGNSPNAKSFPQQERLKLPVSPATLASVKQGLLNVTQTGAGTARSYFAGAKVKVAGKTGTAESGQVEPHSWFACYAPADKPKYVVIVMLENYGENKPDAAGPTARKMIDFLSF